MSPRRLTSALLLACALPAIASAQGTAPGQGALRMGAAELWSQNIKGQGQTVVVLDRGFATYENSSAAGELPPLSAIPVKSMNARFGIAGDASGKPNVHGTRVAEVVHDVAPKARLVFVSYDTEEEFIQATAWIASQRYPIVVHSNSFLTPPFDGTGPMAKAVNAAARAGVAWFNSAGNFGQRHFAGRFAPDATGVMGIPLPASAGDLIYNQLAWTSPLSSAYTLSLQAQQPDGTWRNELDANATFPFGQRLGYFVTPGDGPWRLAVRQTLGPPGGEISIISRTNEFGALNVREGSITTPSDADGAIAVGGTKGVTDNLIAASSWGPRPDGTIKPDISAPTEIHTGMTVAGGTSGAAPHAAGAAALLRQRMTRAARGTAPRVGALRAELVSSARDLGPMGPDNQYGYGVVRLDRTMPVVSFKKAGARIVVSAKDAGKVMTLAALRGGVAVRTARAQSLTLTRPVVCAPGFSARATDWAGNVTQRRVSAKERKALCGKPR